MAAAMVGRWWIYLREAFRPGSRLLFALMLYVGIQLAYQALRGRAPLALTLDIVPGAITIWLILLYYRLSDEFKDAETDRLYFPERPVPSGRVRLDDLRILLWLDAAVLIALNAIWGRAALAFAALLGFAFLMRHWFFLEGTISRNRLLAFATHAPVSLFANFFVLSVYANRFGEPLFARGAAFDTVFVAIWFALPAYAWEIARKTRAPGEEQPGYQTYSAMLGPRASALIALAFIAGHVAGFVAVAGRLDWSPALLAVVGAAAAAAFVVLGRFVARPATGGSPLRPVTELYTLAISVAPIGDLALRRGIAWV